MAAAGATSIERAKPLLGTIVSVRARFAHAPAARAALDAAFAEIATVHRLMSFHEADSDLSRLHRQPPGTPVEVDARTAEVLRFALALAQETGGAVDPAIGHLAVGSGALPRPGGRAEPGAGASWRDIALEGRAVACQRPLWIDLGGIAKGFAVDRAVEMLLAAGALQGCVNAGGDLRVFGPEAEPVALRVLDAHAMPWLSLHEGAAAASGGLPHAGTRHFNPGTGQPVDPALFVCVTAPECMTADALTKAVLVMRESAAPVLAQHRANAHLFDPAVGWVSS